MYALTTIVVIFACLLASWCVLFLGSKNLANESRDEISRSRETDDIARRNDVARLRDLVNPNARLSTNDARRVDCSEVLRFCTSDAECSVMCRTYETVSNHCQALTHTCQPMITRVRTPPSSPGGDDGDRANDETCDLKAGEYAMLVGYTNIGAAIWQCVQMYKHFQGSFCEHGTFRMDARLREPSYRDCECPAGTQRMIKRLADQYDTQLPHCIAQGNVRFYVDDMIAV